MVRGPAERGANSGVAAECHYEPWVQVTIGSNLMDGKPGDDVMPQLATKRMDLRPFRREDWQDLARINGDARAMDTLSADGKPLADDAIQARTQAHAAHWDAHGFGLWHVTDRASGSFCAYAGLRFVVLDGRPVIELAYAVVPDFWQQGRARELARVTLDEAFARLALEEAWCFTLTRNIASRRTMEGAGFQYSHDGDRVGLPHVFYTLTRARWQETCEV